MCSDFKTYQWTQDQGGNLITCWLNDRLDRLKYLAKIQGINADPSLYTEILEIETKLLEDALLRGDK